MVESAAVEEISSHKERIQKKRDWEHDREDHRVEKEKISLRGVQELEESRVVELSGRRIFLEVWKAGWQREVRVDEGLNISTGFDK